MQSQTDISNLPWRFEAFREYVVYQSLQPASAVLSLFEGERISGSNPRIKKLEKLLAERTGKLKWVPSRSGSEDIAWNPEGDFTRNKERVFTSLLVMYPKELSDNRVKLTDFGIKLAHGQVSEYEYYSFILFNFKFPHPAYSDVWREWRKQKLTVYPFLLIMQCLLDLYKIGKDNNYITTKEIEHYLMPMPFHSRHEELTTRILDARKNDSLKDFKGQGDQKTRKINDLLGFLCVSGFCFYRPDGSVALNTIGIHPQELTWFEGVRKPAKKSELDLVKKIDEKIALKLAKENLI